MKTSAVKTLLAFFIAALLIVLVPAPVLAAPHNKTIRIEASNFAFDPGEVFVNPGDEITIELVSKDVTHGLSIDGYTVDVLAEPGQTARVSFTADRPGAFKIRCTMPCGNLHPFMTGKLLVGPNWLLIRGIALALLGFTFVIWKNKRG